MTDTDTVDEFELPPRHWRPRPIKRKGGIRVVMFFQPMGGMVTHNEMCDVPADQAQAITTWLDRHIRRR